MKLSHCALAAALSLALSAGSAAADEQLTVTKNVSQPTVMSDVELDQVVGGTHVMNKVFYAVNAADIWSKGGGKPGAIIGGFVLPLLAEKAP
jgi:hypothetical protein